MKYFEHENVMKLLGVSLDEYCNPEIILPLMDKGDLLTYIKKPQNDITYKQVNCLMVTCPFKIFEFCVGGKVCTACSQRNAISEHEKCDSS